MMKPIKEETRNLSPEELSELIPDLLFVEAWASAVRQAILDALEYGYRIPGAALQPKQGSRKWTETDEEVIKSRLRLTLVKLNKPCGEDVIAPRNLVSLAAAEKLVGKPNLKELADLYAVVTPPGHNLKLTL